VDDDFHVNLNGEKVPVHVRRNSRAKRLILRIDHASGAIKLTLPLRANARAAEKFLSTQHDWLLRGRAAIAPLDVVGNGSKISYLGEMHDVVFTGMPPRRATRADGKIHVGGPIDMAPKRLEKWVRTEAKKLLDVRAAAHAETLAVSYKRISIGDMSSRWGSCSATGTLRFNWRLLMAPPLVLDYVAAHEVAHLREMNHSDKFWAEVAKCVPDHKALRRWLKTEGSDLFKIRF